MQAIWSVIYAVAYTPFILNIAFLTRESKLISWKTSYLIGNFVGVMGSFFEDCINVFIVLVMRQLISKLLKNQETLNRLKMPPMYIQTDPGLGAVNVDFKAKSKVAKVIDYLSRMIWLQQIDCHIWFY
jgi:hypothetical protein